MKHLLVIQHSLIETPGRSYTQLFVDAGFRLSFEMVYEGGPTYERFAPPPHDDLDLVFILGGPMSANDDYQAFRKEEEFLRQVLAAQKPVFAVCLGAQLLSKALGGRVEATGGYQIGLRKLHVTDEGDRDPVLGRLEVPLVPTLHGDCFTIPPGAAALAEGDMLLRDGTYRRINMAFRYGNSYGFQFEPQLILEEFTVWNRDMYDDYRLMGDRFDPVQEAARNQREFNKYAPFYERQSREMLRAFLLQGGLA